MFCIFISWIWQPKLKVVQLAFGPKSVSLRRWSWWPPPAVTDHKINSHPPWPPSPDPSQRFFRLYRPSMQCPRMVQALRWVRGMCLGERACVQRWRREGRGESRHLCPPGARRQQLSSQVSGSYLCCSFQREINDLVKTSHAPCCGLGPSQRSCSAEPFYKPATIYTPNEVLINYRAALPGGGRVNTSF